MRTKLWQAGTTGTIFGLALAFGVAGCKSSTTTQPATIVDANAGADPAAANLAPVDTSTAPVMSSAPAPTTRVLSSRATAPQYSNGESYQQTAPNNDQNYQDNYQDQDYDQNQADAGQAAIYAPQAPPPLPEYQQPELTEPGYEWTPGYWSYGSGGYYWVPGAWVAPPYQQALWTPGYWGYNGGRYGFHRGYWARHIGFYGGINYGFGYVGFGYQGGYWNNNNFYYNNNVNRVNVNIVRNVYVRNVTVVNNTYVNNRVSYNGPGGVRAQPRPQELAVQREQRTPPMQVQEQHAQAASQNRQQFYSQNHGNPAVAAAPEHFAADQHPPQPIRQNAAPAQAQRAGFGQPNQQQAQQQQAREQEQQRTQQLNQQHTQQVQQQQQAREQQQQRTQQLNQQRNTQVQQQQQARVQQQQRTQQLTQQHDEQVQQQQRQQQTNQQHTEQVQQQQRTAQVQQQQRTAQVQQQQRSAQVQQQQREQQQRPVQQAPHQEEHPKR